MFETEWAGQVDYQAAWDWQKQMVAAHATDPETPDKLLLLEHPPTYTLGRQGDVAHLLLDEAALAAEGIAVHHVDRGGDITYHGPGQLVGYPIFNLKRLYRARGYKIPDLHLFIREIEECLIVTLAEFGVRGWRFKGYTGVWVDGKTGPAKLAAIGLRVNARGISSHGFALNLSPNLAHFAGIVPCGIEDYGVTSLTAVSPQPPTMPQLITAVTNAFQTVFYDNALAPAYSFQREKVTIQPAAESRSRR